MRHSEVVVCEARDSVRLRVCYAVLNRIFVWRYPEISDFSVSYPEKVDIGNTSMPLVAIPNFAGSFSLRRHRLQWAAGHVTRMLLLASDWCQGDACRIKAIRLETSNGGVVVRAAKGKRILGGLVAQD